MARLGASPAAASSGQRGASLIEALVASALLGIAVVVGLTAWDTAAIGAKVATRKVWANCVARGYAEAVLAAPWATSYDPASPSVTVVVVPRQGDKLQQVTIKVLDPDSRAVLIELAILKARALAGDRPFGDTVRHVPTGCPSP